MAVLAQGTRFGAHAVVEALIGCGITTFFANPGTSEVHLVAALDANGSARPVLCLHENVATGAADGYGRACGKPAAVLLHLGPGLANGLSNLHNALKAKSPMIVVVGDHATGHQHYDTPLRSDLDRIAPFAAKAVVRLKPGDDIAAKVRGAVAACRAAPQGPVILIANADVMWSDAPPHAPQDDRPPDVAAEPAPAFLDAAEALCSKGRDTAIVLGGRALRADAVRVAASIGAATGCELFCETFNARHERGAGIPAVERLPYFPEAATKRLANIRHLLLIGSRPPVAFFGSPDQPSVLTPDGADLLALDDGVDALAALTALARQLDAAAGGVPAARTVSEAPTGPLVPRAIWAVLNRLLPANAIVSDEAGVTSVGADEAMGGAEPHVWMNLTGGSIGQGLPVATGAAVACPEAAVIAVHGDGGALYTLQALWTQARERLAVINLIFRNDRYAILDYEMKRAQLPSLHAHAANMFALTDPSIAWVPLARGMGVEATSVATAEELGAALEAALKTRAPTLIEVRLPVRK